MNQEHQVDCDEVRELIAQFPEEAEIIIAMLKEAGEDCGQLLAEEAESKHEH